MKFRTVQIFTGETFEVPEGIQRIDAEGTHAWQVRYGRASDGGERFTAMFSDHTPDGSGAAAALKKACAALLKKIKRMPAATGLRSTPSTRKSSSLPVGISGPVERWRTGRNTPSYSFLVSVPLAKGGNTTKTVYIATANTFTFEREEEALLKAMEIREKAVEKFVRVTTKAKRADARVALGGD